MDILYWLVGLAIYIAAVLFLAHLMGRGLTIDDDDCGASLHESLAAQVGTRNTLQAELLDASAGRIQDAEELARQLSSQGVPAVAAGCVEAESIKVWVSVGPTAVDRVEAALTRLDLVEASRTVQRHCCEMHVQGYHAQLLITPLRQAA